MYTLDGFIDRKWLWNDTDVDESHSSRTSMLASVNHQPTKKHPILNTTPF